MPDVTRERSSPWDPAGGSSRGSRIALAGGSFVMGSDDFYPDERPARRASVRPFALDVHPVTNAAFELFVRETGYVTTAERPLSVEEYPMLQPEERAPGSLVFTGTRGPVPLDDWRRWWRWIPHAAWRQPEGLGSTITGRELHPVVHVSHEDASAYARHVGGRLPTEAEWEFAARGGREPAAYAWGEERDPGGRVMANTWRGAFPYRYDGALGRPGTSPVGTFPANPFGFVDLIGNVWEWTDTGYEPRAPEPPGACCGGGPPAPSQTTRVLKGGSHLCAPEYCLRYRPAARSPQTVDSSSSHIGFRCAYDG